MRFEIIMLNVGNADSSIIRYFGGDDQEVVILIDAGKAQHGDKVVNFIEKYTDSGRIDLAICTHPDDDHIGGFHKIFDYLEVDEFWMHDARKYRRTVASMLNMQVSDGSHTQKLLESINQSIDLMDRVRKMTGVRLREPFAGRRYSKAPLCILAPTRDFYLQRLKNFREIDDLLKDGEKLLFEDYNFLKERKSGIDSSNENNSSAVTLFHPGNKKYLFTADADISGLAEARKMYNLKDLDWLQLPHHGSRYNINTENLTFFNPKAVYISASGTRDKPHPEVIHLIRKNTDADIFLTGHHGHLCRSYKMPADRGRKPLLPL